MRVKLLIDKLLIYLAYILYKGYQSFGSIWIFTKFVDWKSQRMSEKLENNATTVAARCSATTTTTAVKPIFQKSQNSKFAVQERVVRPQILTSQTPGPLRDHPNFRRPPQSSGAAKETVLPTAFVSPHTVQINVQPSSPYPTSPAAPSSPPPPTLTSLVASYMAPAGHYSTRRRESPVPYSAGRQDFRETDYHLAHRPIWRRDFDSNNNETNRVSWHGQTADSDERLNKLEERMKMLESQLTPKEDENACKCCSKSMRDLSSGEFRQQYANSAEPLSQSTSFQNLTTSVYEPSSRDKVHYMSEQIRDLQRILEEDQTNFGGRRSYYSLANRNAAVWQSNAADSGTDVFRSGAMKNSMSLDNILRENKSLHETVDDLKHKLEAVSTSSLAPDQYVTMQRYRLLKAKSKKLLQDKCEALRTALLERDSAQVKMQLQDKELSELRREVYEHKCVCKDNENDEQLNRLYSEMLQLCKVSAQTSSCLLDVCKDISNKRCPDYDQILGLKVNDDTLKRTLKVLGGSSTSLNCSNPQNVDQSILTEQLLSLHKSTVQNLNQMQKLMVDYYTNELVDSIDCRLQ